MRGGLAERADDLFVDAADPDQRVRQVDHRVFRGIEAGKDGANGDGFACSDFAGDHAGGAFADAPADAGDGFVVGGVAVQHAGGEVASEGHAGEAVVRLQFFDHQGSPGKSLS